jgi:hypothetical protein
MCYYWWFKGQHPYFLETPLHRRMGFSVDIDFYSDNAPTGGRDGCSLGSCLVSKPLGLSMTVVNG